MFATLVVNRLSPMLNNSFDVIIECYCVLLPNAVFFSTQVEVQTQIDFWSDPVERTPLQGLFGSSSALRSDHDLEMVWSEVILVWKVWSKADSSALGSDQRQFRAQLGLIIGGFQRNFVWSEAISSAIGSDHKCLQTQLGLIRDHFERIIFFIFFCFFFTERCWLCQEAAKKQLSDQRLI